ncbi:MAG: Kelch repeat-containing protein [Candidatus Polarisedimenticolia bacterium]
MEKRGRCVLLELLIAATIWMLSGEPSEARALSLQERIHAQEAIERVYHAHQTGDTRRFEEAVPRAVLEKKVRTYLEQSIALTALWKTPVTTEMLHRELKRMASGTRMPERLRELYASLGDDPFLIQEALARPALVERLARNFFAYDMAIHARERREAEDLREELAQGELEPRLSHPRRRVVELVRIAGNREKPPEGMKDRASRLELQPDEFDRYVARIPARIGEIGPVQEEREAFVTRVVLGHSENEVQVASFIVPKRSWDEWWGSFSGRLDWMSVNAVAPADGLLPLPESSGSSVSSDDFCLADDTWDNGILDDPAPRASHTAVWTGSLMIVWGGQDTFDFPQYLDTGGRYDPATDTWTATTKANAPSPRSGHTAVWTGSRMVVWGGSNGSSTLNTGGRYDPVTDTWAGTTTANAPSIRSGHIAVWTGSLMLVWGGSNGSSALNTGGRYDPATDTWAPTTTVNAPRGRERHAAVWTGSRMIVWGGYDNFTFPHHLDTGGRYDPGTDTWTATTTSNAPSARQAHSAVWTGSRMVVWGGFSGSLHLDTGGQYDPITDTWAPTSTANAPASRLGHHAVWTGSQMVVWGGDSGGPLLDSGGRYDPATDTWNPVTTTNAPSGRRGHTSVWTGGLMMVWGGYDDAISLNGVDTGGRYDPATDTWTPTSTKDGPSPRYGHTAIWTGHWVLVWGGYSTEYATFLGSGGRYDPAIDTWTPTSFALAGRGYHTAIWTGSVMVVWGGVTLEEGCTICGGDDCCGLFEVYFGDGARYDPIINGWTWITGSNAPSARRSHTSVWTGSQMVVWGGYDGNLELDTGGRYDPATNTWAPTSTTNAPSSRSGHASLWTGDRMVVWGGGIYSGLVGTGGRYAPATDTWTPTSTTNAPSVRSGHTAVWTGSEMVVWGGFTGGVTLDTGGRYDLATDTWTPTSITNAPSSRSGHTSIWTGNRIVVWGGWDGGVGLDTGSRYDPAADTWSPTSTINAPSARYEHTAVWTGSQMVVWGGYDGSNGLDTGGRYVLGHGVDNDEDGFSECQGDCNDGNASISPGAGEVCNGLDENCDGSVDEGSPVGGIPCTSLELFGPCSAGLTSCATGPLTCIPFVPPSPEICDGIDNDCDGYPDDNAQTPLGTPSVDIVMFGQTAVLGWGPLPDATAYDVLRGSLDLLSSTAGNFTQATQTCLANDLADSALVLSGSPAAGSGFFYLVRGTNCGGGGTYDAGDPAQAGSCDAEIGASSHRCP